MFNIGEVVVSTQGRDKNNYYLVKEVTENYVLVIDGDLRSFYNPKKKNPKHLQSLNENCKQIFENFSFKDQAINSEIRKTLKKFKEQ